VAGMAMTINDHGQTPDASPVDFRRPQPAALVLCQVRQSR
jgi:hypothetical protein